MVYVWSPILIGDNKRKYSSQQPWIHGTSLMRALHVWSCVTDFSSLTALLGYLVTCKIRAHSPSPDGRYQIICNFVRTCYEPLAYANLIFDRCVAARLCQQTRYIVPVESAGANRVPIVPEDSGSHRHRVLCYFHFDKICIVSHCYASVFFLSNLTFALLVFGLLTCALRRSIVLQFFWHVDTRPILPFLFFFNSTIYLCIIIVTFYLMYLIH